MRFSMDPSWRRPASGDAVIAGSPVRVFRLTAAGRGVAEAIERFRKAAELDPTNRDALRELRLHDLRSSSKKA